MPNFIELHGYINTINGPIGWSSPKRPTPIPRNRDEMATQLDATWSDLRTAMLDHAFPPKFTVGDEPEARDD